MAKFTETQAKACKILTVDKLKNGDNYIWNIGLIDNEGSYYSISVNGLSGDSTKADLKAAAILELQVMEKMSPGSEESEDLDENFDAGIGETLA